MHCFVFRFPSSIVAIVAATAVIAVSTGRAQTIVADILTVAGDADLGAPGTALQFNGGVLQAAASFSSSRDVSFAAGGGTFNTGIYDLDWHGSFSGSGGLTKLGAGYFTLTGGTHSLGATTVAEGALIAQDVAVISSGNLSTGGVTSTNAQFTLSGANASWTTTANVVVHGTDGNSASVTISNGASLAAKFGGVFDDGTSAVQAALTVSGLHTSLNTSNAFSVDGGRVSLLDRATATTGAITLNAYEGRGSVMIGGGAQWTTTGDANINGERTSQAGETSAPIRLTVTGSNSLLGTGRLFLNEYAALTVTDGAAVTTTGSAYVGTGTVINQSLNSYATVSGSGSTWSVSNTLDLGRYYSNAQAYGHLTVADGGTLTVGPSGSGTINIDTGSTLTIGVGGGAGIVAAAALNNDGTLAFNHSDNLTFSATIADLGGSIPSGGTLTKAGSGTLTLAGTNTYSGHTWIKDGTLSVATLAATGTASALGKPANATNGRIKLGATTTTGTLRYTGDTVSTNRGFELAGTTGGGTLDASGSGALVISGTVTSTAAGNKTLTLTGTNTDANTLSGVISNASGSTAVHKTGTGTWVLSGNNTFSGGVTVADGVLRATVANALGSGHLTLSGGTLQLARNANTTFTVAGVTVAGDATLQLDRLAAAATSRTFTVGPLTIGSHTLTLAQGPLFDLNSTGSLTFGATTLAGDATLTLDNVNGTATGVTTLGALDDGGIARTFTKKGAGTLTLSAAATSLVAGTVVNVDAGRLNANEAGALGSHARVALGATATFNLGASQAVAALNGTAGSQLILGTHTLTIGSADSPLDSSFAGSIAATRGSLIKTGIGTLTLSGANHHTGGTTIAAGTLQLGADDALGSGTLTMSGGTLALANFNQTLAALTLAGNAIFDFGAGTSTLMFADSSALAWAGTLTLFNYTIGTDTLGFGSATGLTLDQLSRISLAGYTVTGLDAGGLVQFSASAIPEPSTYAALFGAAALALALHRKRSAA